MGFVSFAGRVLFASVFLISAYQEFTEFGADGGPAANALRPKFNLFIKHLASNGIVVPHVEVRNVIAATIALKGLGGLLFIFSSSFGAYLLLLYLAFISPIAYNFYNYEIEKPEFVQLFIKFTQNLALFGSLLFYLGMKNSTPIKVEKLMNIERYSHVMHISSTVTGELFDHLTCWDALRAALPVGTVSGAPKVKAMELIDRLEVTRRGPYSGGFGGVSFSGDMDIAIALRTIVFPTRTRYDTMYSYKDVNRRKEWVAHLQAGAGIVADSNPDDEQRECENKAAALARAIDLAESTFVEKV